MIVFVYLTDVNEGDGGLAVLPGRCVVVSSFRSLFVSRYLDAAARALTQLSICVCVADCWRTPDVAAVKQQPQK